MRQGGLEPILAHRRSGVASAPVLVVGHQHNGVGDRLEELEVPVVVAERGRDPHFAADRLQRRAGFREHGGIGLERRGAQVLEVEHVTRPTPLLGKHHEVLDQSGAGGGIDQQIAGERSVIAAVVAVVDHRQDRRWRLAPRDQGLGHRIVGHRHPAERAV